MANIGVSRGRRSAYHGLIAEEKDSTTIRAKVFIMKGKIGARANRRPRAASLRREQAVYEARGPRWLREHEGEHALIKGDEVLGFFRDARRGAGRGIPRGSGSPRSSSSRSSPRIRSKTFPTCSSDAGGPRPDWIRRAGGRSGPHPPGDADLEPLVPVGSVGVKKKRPAMLPSQAKSRANRGWPTV